MCVYGVNVCTGTAQFNVDALTLTTYDRGCWHLIRYALEIYDSDPANVLLHMNLLEKAAASNQETPVISVRTVQVLQHHFRA